MKILIISIMLCAACATNAQTLDPLLIAQLQQLNARPTFDRKGLRKYKSKQPVTKLESFQPKDDRKDDSRKAR